MLFFIKLNVFVKTSLVFSLPLNLAVDLNLLAFEDLASHGATIGMIISMYLYNKKVLKKSILWILDRVVIACALGAIFITHW